VQAGFDAGGHLGHLVALAAAGLVTVFGMWWVYFDRPGHEVLASQRSGFVWGYGHYLIFGAAAAVGAGIAVNVDVIASHAAISPRAAAWSMAVPVAIYLLCVWLLHRRPGTRDRRTVAFPAAAAAVLLAPLVPGPLTVIALVMVALVAVTG
jgi:low temperature requirement protein LtrA